MKNLATMIRSSHLFAQNGHHAVSGPTFQSDHELAGLAYEELHQAYDEVVESGIGEGLIPVADLNSIQSDAAEMLPELPKDNESILRQIQSNDQAICRRINYLISQGELSQGTTNALAGVADKAQHRWSFLFARRLAS